MLEKAEVVIRVCPERDAVCPHGMACPYSKGHYDCDMVGSRAALLQSKEEGEGR